MKLGQRSRGTGSANERAALAAALADPLLELIPLKNLADQVPHLPAGARVSVTASPAKGLEATLDWSAMLAADGFRVTPHLSARMVRDRAHLAALLDQARAGGLDHAFVVGGDAEEPGDYPDGLSLLHAMAELGHPFASLGCPAYPEGHPVIPDDTLLGALGDKAPYVDHVTTQLSFNTAAIARWVGERREAGFTTPVVLGVPGVSDPQRLLSIAARVGVKDARRFVTRNLGFVTGLARSGGFYRPTGFVNGVAPLLADPAAAVTGFHLYTFNAVEATDRWLRETLERLAD